MSQLNSSPKNHIRGLSSLELIVIITVLLAALTVAIPLFLNKTDLNRQNMTWKKLLAIKTAMIGDASLLERGNRCSFGFIGDLGVRPNPNNLGELLDRDASRPLYGPFASFPPLYYGWNGPYLDNSRNASGLYTALLDAWGNPFYYNNDVDLDPTTWDMEIRSNGPNGILEINTPGSDDIAITIPDHEVQTYVTGIFTDRHKNPIHESLVTVYYPNGTPTITTLQITPNAADSTRYDSRVDTLSPAGTGKIPIGNRYFETGTYEIKKFATLNQRRPLTVGLDAAQVNFVGPDTTPTEPEFERNFYATDNTDATTGSPITPVMGTWETDNNGNYYATGTLPEYRAVFGKATWQDYRVEVDATLIQGTTSRPSRGYGIYYRSNGLANISGYCFQYDPGFTSGGRVAFLVRRVVNGGEQPPFQSVVRSLVEFPNVFGVSHHISITVSGLRHIIKVDGSPVFDFTDNTFMVGQPGLRSWDGSHYTNFHHLRVHGIPLLSTKEFVWWSFEEGGADRVYGSCFLIDAPEINGTITNLTNMYRRWQNTNIHGQAIYSNGLTNAYINHGDELDFNPTETFSVSAWIRIDTINVNNEYVIVSKIQQGNQRGWKLYLDQISSYNFGASFAFQQGANSQQLIRHNNLQITAGRWFHILVTYDGTGATGDIDTSALNLYVTPFENNAIQTTPTLINISSGLRSSSNTANTGNMLIGAEINGSNRFNGSIDEVRVFKVALTATERNTIFRKEK